ncbi:hypothetical protein XH86_05170 [Bradyrhizobium guangdongense]|uniref:Uncharacterized protein n=1 Tax=Bradyrhizobium guangdongense TaxID=1325090 RepID=A0ABX6UAA0_9BRAD|nr:hypothetical protein X265_05175 [Bradyrhizobium guangdongense]QOZ58198.1 hypothetical protein XH86_05170 [Bradyrhizobium guangdongense]
MFNYRTYPLAEERLWDTYTNVFSAFFKSGSLVARDICPNDNFASCHCKFSATCTERWKIALWRKSFRKRFTHRA